MEKSKIEFLTIRLEKYMSMPYELLPDVLGYEVKQNVGRIRAMLLEIYTNDHNPPHFHVRSLDGKIDAKFTLSDCTLLSGEVSRTDMKRIQAYFDFQKNMMNEVWNKRN